MKEIWTKDIKQFDMKITTKLNWKIDYKKKFQMGKNKEIFKWPNWFMFHVIHVSQFNKMVFLMILLWTF